MTRKVIRKIVGGILIISALVVYVIPSGDVTADTASTSDFQLNGSTLVKYQGTASAVSIPDTVEIIGEEAFADNASLASVVIPNTVEKISYAAFSGCKNLSKVVVPDSVEEIETASFCNCASLVDVTLGSGLKKLGAGVFTGCNSLTDVKINSPKFVCVDSVIYDKDKTKLYQVLPGKKEAAYSMPNTITNVVAYAFYGCNNLNAVTISSNLDEISAFVFSNCNGLKSVSIPYSVNTIDAKAFENCVYLSDVTIPESVNYIHPTAFDGCPRLNIVAPEFTYAYNWFKSMDRSQVSLIDSEDNNIEKASDTDSANSLDKQGNSKSVSDNEHDVPGISPTNTPENIEDIANSYVSAEGLIGETIVVGRKAVVFIDNTRQTVVEGVSSPRTTDNYSDIVTDMSDALEIETNGKGLSLPKFAIIGDHIADKAFYADSELKSYEISDEITSLGDFSFARSGLKSIDIPEGVTNIGYGAFYHCDDLSNITIPATVTNIEPSAFDKTRMMENWMEYGSGDYFICGDHILAAYRGKDSKITIPEGVKQIGPGVFMNHKGITDLILPDSLERICEDAFFGCNNLKNVSGGVNLQVIEDRAFSGCPLDSIRIVDSVTEIGMGAYDFDKTKASDDQKAVVFLGDTLPKLSYNSTTTRLSNENYRLDAFSGVKVAIVNSEEVNRTGTVLDRNVSGFSGLICVIAQENNDYFNGVLNIIDCTLTPDEAACFEIPDSMIIFGKGYNFNQEQLFSVLDMACSGSFEEADASDEEEADCILTTFEGSDAKYRLYVAKEDSVSSTIKDGYMRIYGDTVPGNLTTYTISLKEENNDVWLTKFGKQKLNINLKLPENVPTENLHVICTDEDEQLEDLPFKVVDNNGVLCVSFDISHTGNYGLYAFNSTAVSKYDLDESPDTSDPVNPKNVLSIGLFLAGLALLLIRGKKG